MDSTAVSKLLRSIEVLLHTEAAKGATRIAECGPGKVLSGLAKRIDKGLDARAIGQVGEFESALADWSQA